MGFEYCRESERENGGVVGICREREIHGYLWRESDYLGDLKGVVGISSLFLDLRVI